eukprot:5777-Heterococcus_DN1.PRE.1
MCEFLRAQQCPWDSSSPHFAAIGGHADCLRWLLDNGCPRQEQQLCMAAAQGGSVEVLTYLQQQGILTSSTTALACVLNMAGEFNKLDAAKWMIGAGAEWPSTSALCAWLGEARAWATAESNAIPLS